MGSLKVLYSQRGDDARCCTIRSTDTNTVLRPGESREGDGRKKKVGSLKVLHSLLSVSNGPCLLLISSNQILDPRPCKRNESLNISSLQLRTTSPSK